MKIFTFTILISQILTFTSAILGLFESENLVSSETKKSRESERSWQEILSSIFFAVCLGSFSGCTSPSASKESAEKAREELIKEAIDSLASIESDITQLMTDKGIREYMAVLGQAYILSRINNSTRYNPKIAKLASENLFSGDLVNFDDSVNRDVATSLLASVFEDQDFFLPGRGLFFRSEEIKKIEFHSEIVASVKFVHAAIDFQYRFVLLNGEWLFDGFESISEEGK